MNRRDFLAGAGATAAFSMLGARGGDIHQTPLFLKLFVFLVVERREAAIDGPDDKHRMPLQSFG
jgi:hypothetical protein